MSGNTTSAGNHNGNKDMKVLKALSTATLLSLAIGTVAVAADLTVTVGPVKEAAGKLLLALYDKPDDFRQHSFKAMSEAARVGDMTVTFSDLEPGDYAVMVFQDVNDNGDLDNNMFGLPKEPWGGSLGDRQLFGAPTWSDAVISVPADGLAIAIKLNH